MNQYLAEDKGHKALPAVRLEPATPQSQVKHTTLDHFSLQEKGQSFLLYTYKWYIFRTVCFLAIW